MYHDEVSTFFSFFFVHLTSQGGTGSANAILFAKIFLEETRGGGEAYESDTAWG